MVLYVLEFLIAFLSLPWFCITWFWLRTLHIVHKNVYFTTSNVKSLVLLSWCCMKTHFWQGLMPFRIKMYIPVLRNESVVYVCLRLPTPLFRKLSFGFIVTKLGNAWQKRQASTHLGELKHSYNCTYMYNIRMAFSMQ
uniref:Putative secreted protein n=1 Tax=Rhipicephalus microplus TaxID=6941 RepID=A0A6M2DC88_RHIMP